MIQINNLGKAYNQNIVLNIPELQIGANEIFGLVGNNGAGKTTLFRLILDLIKANKGEVLLNSENVTKSDNWKKFTASYLDENFLIDFLSPEEYFYFVGNTCGLNKDIINHELTKFESFFNDEILNKKKKYIRDFSKGNKQKIGIAATFLTHPKVLILDEPFNGLDPTSQIILKRMLVDYKNKYNATLLISSHDLNHITDICTRVALLEKGCIIRDMANSETILNDLESYFSIEKSFHDTLKQ
jgi:ABC-2 type transport system ATP-binding protein